MLRIYSTADVHSSVRYTVAGELAAGENEEALLTDIRTLEHSPGSLRLDRLFFSLDKGMRASLHWEDAEKSLLLPVEDRGFFDFEHAFGGWSNPKREGWTGNVILRVEAGVEERLWRLALKLEFTKQTR